MVHLGANYKQLMPRIIIDENIPLIKGLLEPFAEIDYLPYQEITTDAVKHADALIIRTRTKCNEKLLKNSRVKFIATATIGTDHIDADYCKQHNISWVSAPGCNAMSVKQYVMSTLLYLANARGIDLKKRTLGIIGVGNVGSKIKDMADTWEMKTILNDPPRERDENRNDFASLQELVQKADIITVHVPLINTGMDKTWHLFHEGFEKNIQRGTWFLNTSRGEVVTDGFVKAAIDHGILDAVALDVWEHEPHIDPELLHQVAIATPHIAGYSIDGKNNATHQCVSAVCRFFDWDDSTIPWAVLPEPVNKRIEINGKNKSEQEIWYEAIRRTYDVLEDDRALRANPGDFEKLRSQYGVRREPQAFELKYPGISRSMLKKLEHTGFKIMKS